MKTDTIPIWYATSAHVLCEAYVYLQSNDALVRDLLVCYIYTTATTVSWFRTLELRSTNLIYDSLVPTCLISLRAVLFPDLFDDFRAFLCVLLTGHPIRDGIILT